MRQCACEVDSQPISVISGGRPVSDPLSVWTALSTYQWLARPELVFYEPLLRLGR